MDQKEKDRIAAELATDYRETIRETADAEMRNKKNRTRSAASKSVGVAYALWFFLGGLGAHRFYLGYTATGAAMLVGGICGVIFSMLPAMFVFSLPLLGLLSLWWLIDAFLIPRMMTDALTY